MTVRHFATVLVLCACASPHGRPPAAPAPAAPRVRSSVEVTAVPDGAGTIRGTVVDAASGLPVLLVTVIADSSALGGRSRAEFTDDRGNFAFSALPPGTYALTFFYADAILEQPKVVLGASGTLVVNARLDTTSAPEVITIKDHAPGVDSGSTKQGTTLQQDYTKNIPSRNRQGDDHGLSHAGATSLETLAGMPSSDELWIIARGPASRARSAPGLGSGQLRVVGKGDDLEPVLLPLEHTDVRARILGYIASVEVEQRYENPYATTIEVEYVFPLPENAAVADFVMTVGDRKIRGVVRDRAEAEELYAEARSAGYVASLMTEERPNVFTQRIANIEPKKQIDIALTYFNTLPYGDGAYSFVFPMVVGPRYNPAGAPPVKQLSYLSPQQRSRHRLSLSVELDAGTPLATVASPTHLVNVTVRSPRERSITLAEGEVTPDRDFVLRWKPEGRTVQPAFFHDGETFALLLAPPADLGQLRRAPMEMVFVLDCSGSMSGAPLASAKRTVHRVLDKLGPEDTVQIINFSSSASAMGARPVRATPENLERARRWLDSLGAEGGTEMITGIRAALAYPKDPKRVRLVSFLTDGYIGNEAEILAEVERLVGTTRIFSFGVGTAVNRFLLEKLAQFGRGAAAFVGLGDGKEDQDAVDAFYERISHPALADVSVDWNGMQVSDVLPRRIPDLVVGRPVVITGRLTGKVAPWITVRGRAGGGALEQRVPIERVTPHPALAKVWARAAIGALGDEAIVARDRAPLLHKVKETALRHGLLSPYTAFIAVDAATRVQPGTTTVPVAVPVPSGVSYEKTVAPR